MGPLVEQDLKSSEILYQIVCQTKEVTKFLKEGLEKDGTIIQYIDEIMNFRPFPTKSNPESNTFVHMIITENI